MVAHLQDAAFYDLMVVFTKCRVGFVDKLVGVAPLYSLHGHLADMVARAATDLPSLLDMCRSPVREGVSWPDFSHTWSRGGRSVTLSLTGLTKLVTNWTMAEGELVLDTRVEGLLEGGKVYIITEVVYAHGGGGGQRACGLLLLQVPCEQGGRGEGGCGRRLGQEGDGLPPGGGGRGSSCPG